MTRSRVLLSCVALLACALFHVDAQVQGRPRLPAWLNLIPNYRSDEMNALSHESSVACERRFPLRPGLDRLDAAKTRLGLKWDDPAPPELQPLLKAQLAQQDKVEACERNSAAGKRERALEALPKPEHYVLPAFAGPDFGSASVGFLDLVFDSTIGDWKGVFHDSANGTTEIFGQRYTVSDRVDDWLKLPSDPLPTPIWINWKFTFLSEPSLDSIFDGYIVTGGVEAQRADGTPVHLESAVISLSRRRGTMISFRVATVKDSTCPESNPEEVSPGNKEHPGETLWMPFRSLFQPSGDLAVGPWICD